MANESDPLDAELAALREATAQALPTEGFASALDSSLVREGPARRWIGALTHQARRALFVALVSALVLGAVLWKLEHVLMERTAEDVLSVVVPAP